MKPPRTNVVSKRIEILAKYESNIDPSSPRAGISGTLFRTRQGGAIQFAIRGTEGLEDIHDLIADADLAIDEAVGATQIVAMVN